MTTTNNITTQVLTFQKEEEITLMVIEGSPYFVGNDVAKVLGYVDYKDTISKCVDDSYKARTEIVYKGVKRDVTLINELGALDLIKGSPLKDTRDFKVWLLREVLPSIHKYGTYLTPQEAEYNYRRMAMELEDKNRQINACKALSEQRRKEIQNLLSSVQNLQTDLSESKKENMELRDDNLNKICEISELSKILRQK